MLRLSHRASLCLPVAALVLASALYAAPAAACGGCFVPPPIPSKPETSTVVTDHRMVLSVGQGQSTLYDQIRYQGAPEAFAWVLPITGEAQVGLSADAVFRALDAETAVSIVPPPRPVCPPQPMCGFGGAAGAPAATATATGTSAPPPPPVTVTKSEVVGPYQTVQLQSTDPQALNAWLADNGFTIPNDVKPIVAAYVNEHFNFLAMKLLPGATVRAMRPVRVTTAGASVVLPLRMVAAGTGAVVGITLWVLAEGRYEPTNFPVFGIAADELVWDWRNDQSNFQALRAQKSGAAGGRGWELESSATTLQATVATRVRNAADDEYTAVPAADGKPARTAYEVREDDLAALMPPGLGSSFRATRLRADLAHAALTEDLVLAAARDQSFIGTSRRVTNETNRPTCPPVTPCPPNLEPGGVPGGGVDEGDELPRLRPSSCAASSGPGAASRGALAATLGALGLVVARLRASRRRR